MDDEAIIKELKLSRPEEASLPSPFSRYYRRFMDIEMMRIAASKVVVMTDLDIHEHQLRIAMAQADLTLALNHASWVCDDLNWKPAMKAVRIPTLKRKSEMEKE